MTDNDEVFTTLANKGNYIELLEYSRSQEGVEARYWELHTLLWMGKTSEVLKKLQEYEPLFVEDIWRSRYLQLVGFTHWGHGSNQALDYYKQAFEIAKRIDYTQGIADYYIFSGIIMTFQNHDQGIEFIETGYKHSLEIDYKFGILWYHSILADRLISRGKYEKGFEHLETASEICKETGNNYFYSLLLTSYGFFYSMQRNHDKALSYHEQAYELGEKTGNMWSMANSLAHIADIYRMKGMLDTSLKYSNERYDLELKGGHQSRIARNRGAIADIYKEKGELNDALENYEHALKIFEEEGAVLLYTNALIKIGTIHRMKGDGERALSYLEKSYLMRLEMENRLYLQLPLINLIPLLSTRDREKAKMYLDKFADIERSETDVELTANFKFTQAMYLKSSNRLKDKMQAQLLFEELIIDADKSGIGTMEYVLHLVELLLIEYASSREQLVLDELHQHLDTLYKNAQKEYRYLVMIRALIIQAQLAQIEGEFSISEQTLDQALSLAGEKNLTALQHEVEKAKSEMKIELARMESVLSKNVDLADKMKHSNLMAYIRKAQDQMLE